MIKRFAGYLHTLLNHYFLLLFLYIIILDITQFLNIWNERVKFFRV